MAAPSKPDAQPITSRAQLIEYLERGVKDPADWRIGTEHEKFGFTVEDRRPLPFDGPRGIEALLDRMVDQFGWEPIREGGRLIALNRNGCNITLEPGGQLELSGAPLATLHETCDEVHTHLHEMRTVSEELRIGLLGMGFIPRWRRDEIPWMPKARYEIMKAYMPKVGNLGLDMMLRTCTVQVNLDFGSEADMVRKFRVGLGLQPIATALFANSPFTEGEPNGYLSYRSHIWTDTDPHRTGMMPFVFEDGMGFERYVDYMLDVPMYFAVRGGQYVDASGQSFRDFIGGRLPALPGEIPTMGDFVDHLTTTFPEVRLKHFLEMRGADGGPWRHICALPALWVGLLYDTTAQDAAWDLVKRWSVEDMQRVRDAVPREGLKAELAGRPLRDWAIEVLEIARQGLVNRAKADVKDADESPYLDALHDIAASGTTHAEALLEAYHGKWRGSVDPVYDEFAF